MAEARMPPPQDGDSEDVHWMLTTAQSLERRGELHEALRWLKRAVAAAAAHSAHDDRAIQLGRCAADLEQALAAASTHRGADQAVPPQPTTTASGTIDLQSKPVPLDGLDEATHVDTAREPIPDEVTLVPFTKKANGVESGSLPANEDTKVSMQAVRPPRDTTPDLEPYDGDDATLSAPVPVQVQASTPDSLRVAVLAAADGEPRLMRLPPGASAPEGSGLALLLPLSSEDAKRILQLLGRG